MRIRPLPALVTFLAFAVADGAMQSAAAAPAEPASPSSAASVSGTAMPRPADAADVSTMTVEQLLADAGVRLAPAIVAANDLKTKADGIAKAAHESDDAKLALVKKGRAREAGRGAQALLEAHRNLFALWQPLKSDVEAMLTKAADAAARDEDLQKASVVLRDTVVTFGPIAVHNIRIHAAKVAEHAPVCGSDAVSAAEKSEQAIACTKLLANADLLLGHATKARDSLDQARTILDAVAGKLAPPGK